MTEQRDLIFFTTVSLIALIFINLPFVLANSAGNGSYHFGGFLLNPLDGNTYLAKMYQGWQGKWRFQLPFTPDRGEGAFLFLSYIALGHFARITGLSLLSVFHIFRIVCSLGMLWALWKFYGAIFLIRKTKRFAYTIASIGSGMGWMFVYTGSITSDFWVAEAYPFLSAYANLHFPLGLALILGILTITLNKNLGLKSIILTTFGTFILSIVNPFGVIILLMVQAGVLLWQIIQKNLSIPNVVSIFLITFSGMPFLIYDLWVVNTDPFFQIWNAQNITPSPPFWDLFISLSPALVLGLFGLINSIKLKMFDSHPEIIVLVIWVFFGIIAIYLPFSLQRRFMMGLYVPIVGLAAIGLKKVSGENLKKFFYGAFIILLLTLPSNLITLMGAHYGIKTFNPQLYLTNAEMAALDWIEDHTEPDSLILASPEMGLFIPAYTGRRVIYGHPFETVNAVEAEREVMEFFSGNLNTDDIVAYLVKNDVELVMLGPREANLGDIVIISTWIEVYNQKGIILYDP